jgi:PEP-CTERM motif
VQLENIAMKIFLTLAFVVGLGITLAEQATGESIVSFPGSDYNSNTALMDQTLGVTGYTIEGFESTTLIPGLSIGLSGFNNGAPNETLTTLPQLYNPVNDGFLSNTWDGTYAVNNTPNNGTVGSYGGNPPVAMTTTFSFAGGASSVGIGLANFQSATPSPTNPFPVTDHTLYINGVAQPGTLESIVGSDWTAGIDFRNAYIRIDAGPGETIDSIGFGNITTIENGAVGDFLVFDHLSVLSSVPEPGSLAILGSGGAAALGFLLLRRVRGR